MAMCKTMNFPKEISFMVGDLVIENSIDYPFRCKVVVRVLQDSINLLPSVGRYLTIDGARRLSERVLGESLDEDGLGFLG